MLGPFRRQTAASGGLMKRSFRRASAFSWQCECLAGLRYEKRARPVPQTRPSRGGVARCTNNADRVYRFWRIDESLILARRCDAHSVLRQAVAATVTRTGRMSVNVTSSSNTMERIIEPKSELQVVTVVVTRLSWRRVTR